MRVLLPRRVSLASLRLRVERRFLADDFLPFSARTTLLRDALLRDELACLFFPNTVPEQATVIRTINMRTKRRDFEKGVLKFMRAITFLRNWSGTWASTALQPSGVEG